MNDGEDNDRGVYSSDADARMGKAVYGILAVVAASVIGWWFINFANAPKVSETRVLGVVEELEEKIALEHDRGNKHEVESTQIKTDIASLRSRISEIDTSLVSIREIISKRNSFDIEDFKRERRVLDTELRLLEVQLQNLDRQCMKMEERLQQ